MFVYVYYFTHIYVHYIIDMRMSTFKHIKIYVKKDM